MNTDARKSEPIKSVGRGDLRAQARSSRGVPITVNCGTRMSYDTAIRRRKTIAGTAEQTLGDADGNQQQATE